MNEDPVTGSAHCKLAYYWGVKMGKKLFTAYQASERGGKIIVKIKDDSVFLTGSAKVFMEGSLVSLSN